MAEDHSLRCINIECGTIARRINHRLEASSLWHERAEGVNDFFLPKLEGSPEYSTGFKFGYAMWRDDGGWHGGKSEDFRLDWAFSGTHRFEKVEYFL